MNQIGINSHHVISAFLVVFDLTGTFIFALSGAIAAIKHRLDAFGVLVLCFVTGNAGGITRDIMIGALPPAAINEWRYVAVSILAGLIVFFGYPLIDRLSSPVLLFDAAGLGLFCVAGADKALAFHAGPVAATLLGMTTGIGGGMIRDLLIMEVPTVLRTELYAVAALLGAAFTVGGQRLGMPLHVAAPIGAALCIILRLLALRYGWHLPAARIKAP
jgi:uncharacterized membrane protein YeiH